MTAIDNNSKTSRQARLRKLLAGMDQHLANVGTFTFAGVVYTRDQLKKLIQTDIDASDASVQAKANFSGVVQLERDSHAKVNPVLRFLKFYIITLFGDAKDASGTLADFGLTPRKSKPKTVAAKAEAIAKNKSTRTARHTAGPKQKAKVKGTAPAAPTAASGAPQPKPTQPTP